MGRELRFPAHFMSGGDTYAIFREVCKWLCKYSDLGVIRHRVMLK